MKAYVVKRDYNDWYTKCYEGTYVMGYFAKKETALAFIEKSIKENNWGGEKWNPYLDDEEIEIIED